MAEFERLKDSLAALQGRELSICDALGLFNDLCDDLHSAGKDLWALPLGEEDRAVTVLAKSSRALLNTIKKNEEALSAIDPRDKVRKQQQSLTERVEALELLEENYDAESAQLLARRKALQEQEDRCRQKHQALEQQRTEYAKLGEVVAALSQQVDRMELEDLSMLEQKKKELLAERAALQARLEQQQLEQSNLVQSNRALQAKVEQQQQEQADLARQDQALQAKAAQLEQDLAQARRRLEQDSGDRQSKQQQLLALREQAQQAKAQTEELAAKIDQAAAAEKQLKLRLEQQLLEQANLAQSNGALQAKAAQLEQDLAQARRRLEQDSGDRQSKQQQLLALREQAQQARAQAEELAGKMDQAVTTEKQLKLRLAQLQNEYDSNRSLYEGLSIKGYQERIDKLQRELEQMHKISKALLKDAEDVYLGDMNRQIKGLETELVNRLKELESKLQSTKQFYRDILANCNR